MVARRVSVLNMQPNVYNSDAFALDGIALALSSSFVKYLQFRNEKGSPFFPKFQGPIFLGKKAPDLLHGVVSLFEVRLENLTPS